MSQTLIVRGQYREQHFFPDDPLPVAEGSAELVITTLPAIRRGSIAETFGTASTLRTAEEIDAQIREERESWSDR